MGKVSRDEVLELIQPTMNWVSTMQTELVFVCTGNYTRFTAEPDHVFTYRERLVELFEDWSVKEVGEQRALTMIELADRCDAWSCALYLMLEQGDERLNQELEDVAFWSGEIAKSIETVRKIAVRLGWTESDEIDELVNFAGADYVGTKTE